MAKLNRQNVWPAIAFLACTGVLWVHLNNFEDSEFSGGWLSGKILTMAEVSVPLFLCALVCTIFLPRIAAIVGLVATALCLPFYLYVVMPGPYRRIFQGEYSFPLQREFAWNFWGVTGIVTLILAALFSVLMLSRPSNSR
jgi:hypothetical protein